VQTELKLYAVEVPCRKRTNPKTPQLSTEACNVYNFRSNTIGHIMKYKERALAFPIKEHKD